MTRRPNLGLRRRPACWVSLAAVVAVLLFVVPPNNADYPAGTGRTSALGPPTISSDFLATPNGNFSIRLPQPSVTVVPGTYLRAQFSVTVVTATSNGGPLEVWVPPTVATFYGSNSTQRFLSGPVTMNLSASGPLATNTSNVTALATFSGAFNQSAQAFLTSQSVALMVNRPFGSVTLSVHWRWLLAFPDGSTITGPWSTGASLEPASYAELVSFGPSTVAPGGSFGVCIGGPIAGRLFSLHLAIPTPFFDFIQVNQSSPPNTTSPICWSATVPTWVQPQPIVARVWDYDQVTLLLYQVRVTVANVTSALATFLAPVSSVGGAVTLAALVVGGALLAVTILRRWRGHRPPMSPTRSDQE